jgi:hypothetical protein
VHGRWRHELAQDLRYSARSLWRSKTFTAVAVASLTLGIGANTAVFSVVSAVVFRPLPFAQADRLVQLYGTPASRGEAVDNLVELRDESVSFDGLIG